MQAQRAAQAETVTHKAPYLGLAPGHRAGIGRNGRHGGIQELLDPL